MGTINKYLAVVFILIVAISCLSLLMVKPAQAQTPSTPSFSINAVSGSNVIPTTYSTDPYTGANITNLGYTITTFKVTITVQNSLPTTAYLLEVKGHYSSNWDNPTMTITT
jgi:hypothetical protein